MGMAHRTSRAGRGLLAAAIVGIMGGAGGCGSGSVWYSGYSSSSSDYWNSGYSSGGYYHGYSGGRRHHASASGEAALILAAIYAAPVIIVGTIELVQGTIEYCHYLLNR